MASPFRTFRKNRKAWMVVLTILSMFAFVVLGTSGRMGSGVGKREDPDVFTWDYGTVHRSELNYEKMVFQALRQFLLSAGSQAGMTPQELAGLSNQLAFSDQSIVNTMLLAKKAEQMGIVISDAAINRAINGITGDKLPPEQLADDVRAISAHFAGIGQTQLFDAMRTLLAASHVRIAFAPLLNRTVAMGGMMLPTFRGETPGERWDYYCRLNRKVTVEMMPVSVEKFVASIPDPSADQLKSFYEQYKTTEADSSSPTPGFRQPFKAKFQYIKADYEQLLAAESPKITQEQIKDYYDTHKEEFKKTKLPEVPQSGESGKSGAETSPAPITDGAKPSETTADESKSKAGDTKPAETKSSDTKSTDTKATGAKSGDAKSSGAKSSAGKTDSTKSSDAKSGDAKKSDSQKKSDDQNKSSNKQSSIWPHSSPAEKPTVATSLDGELLALADTSPPTAQPPVASAPAAKSSGTAASDAKASTAKSSADSKSSSPKSTDAKGSSGKSADDKSTDAKSADAKSSTAKSTDAKSPDTRISVTDRPVEYDPLEKVAETIRTQLAQQKVDDQIDAAFSAIESQIEQYNRSLLAYRAAVSRGNKNTKKPDPPDLATLAKPYGLEAKETDLISRDQARDQTDIGKSRRSLVPGDYNTPPFLQLAFNTDANDQATLEMYQAQRSDDNDRNRYLWWKVADEAAHTPPLDDIKAEVTQSWKMIQARKPALAKANDDAAQARKLKQTLKETFGSVEGNGVATVGPFSWLTQPAGQIFGAPPRITQVSGVDLAGNEFMKSVFALNAGETGVATNEPQTVFYVVQIESEEPSLDSLHEEFMAKMSSPMSEIPYEYVGLEQNRNLDDAWFKEVQNEFGYQLAPGESLADTHSTSSED